MASLLSFVKNKVQQVEHGVGQAAHVVNQDVVQPAIRDVYQPIQHVVAPVERAAIHTVAQAPNYLNPVQGVGRAVGYVAPHIPTFSNSSPLRFANNALINPVKSTGIHVSQLTQGHNPYHGSFGQQVGQAGQDALTLASALPIGKGAEIATKGVPLLSKVAQGAKFGVKAGGGFGAAQGLSQSLQNKNNLKQTAKNVGVNTLIGAGAGGVLGATAPVLGSAVTRAGKNDSKIISSQLKPSPSVPKPISSEPAYLRQRPLSQTKKTMSAAEAKYRADQSSLRDTGVPAYQRQAQAGAQTLLKQKIAQTAPPEPAGLLPQGSTAIQGPGFTMQPEANPAVIKIGKQVAAIDKQLERVRQGNGGITPPQVRTLVQQRQTLAQQALHPETIPTPTSGVGRVRPDGSVVDKVTPLNEIPKTPQPTTDPRLLNIKIKNVKDPVRKAQLIAERQNLQADTPTIVPQQSSEGRLTKLTSLENRLGRGGSAAQEALQTIRNSEVATAQHTQQLKDTAQPFFKLKPEEQAVAIKVQKGEATTTNKGIQAGADSLKSMFQATHQKITATGKKVGNLGENYFPISFPAGHFDKAENFNTAIQHLVNTGQAKDLETATNMMHQFRIDGSLKPNEFGNFMKREVNLPGGTEDANTVANYIKGASKSVAQNEHFGVNHEVLNTHVANAVRRGEDAGALRDVLSSYLHPKTPKPGAVTTGLNAYQKALRVIQLPRAAISHGPQGFANTASDVGYRNYFKALGKKVFKNADTNNFLNEGGFRVDNFGHSSNLSDKATAPGLSHLLQFHREVAAEGGRSMALGLAKNGDVQGLSKMGIDGKLNTASDGSIKLTRAQEIQAGHFEANKSIGSPSPIQSPAWIQSNGGKLVGQYRKMYVFKQSERIANLFSDAKAGNVAPLARYLAVGLPLSGIPIALAKDEIKNPGSNPLKDPRKLATDSLYDSGGLSVGYGLAGSAYNSLTHNYGNDSRWSNAAGAVAPGLGFAVQTGQNLAKAKNGNVKPLEREGLRMSPVGGTYLANKFAPSTLPVKADNSGSTGSPAQQQSNAKVEKAQFKAEAEKNGGYGLNKLSDGTYVYNINGKVHTANNIQSAQKAIRDDAFSQGTGSYKYVPNVNGTGVVVRRGADGKVTEQSKVKFDYQLGTATLTMQKNSGDLKGYVDTAKNQIASIATQLKDPSTDPLEALTLQNQAAALQKNIDKYSGYGGFTKPKSGSSRVASGRSRTSSGRSKGGSSTFKLTKISAKKLTAPKGVKVKKVAMGSLKTRKVSTTKIPKMPKIS